MRCKRDECERRAYTSGFCTTHYRRWRSGKPMDEPIRRYVHCEGDSSDNIRTRPAKRSKVKRSKPFAAEWALLRELGLYEE